MLLVAIVLDIESNIQFIYKGERYENHEIDESAFDLIVTVDGSSSFRL